MRLLVLVLVLAGCASQPERRYEWWKVGTDMDQVRQDVYQCRLHAQTAMAGQPIAYGNTRALAYQVAQQEHIEQACMQARGYQLTAR